MRGTWQTTDSGGGGLGLLAIIALVLLAVGSAGAVLHAAEDALGVLLQLVLIAVACLAGLTLAGVGTWLAVRRRRPARQAPGWAIDPQRAARAVTASSAPRALPAAQSRQELHIHLHGAATTEDYAALRDAIRKD